MLGLSQKWISELASQPETGTSYQVVSIILKNGTRFDQAVVVDGRITQIRGRKNIPFTKDQIAQIIVTHDKWNFAAEH